MTGLEDDGERDESTDLLESILYAVAFTGHLVDFAVGANSCSHAKIVNQSNSKMKTRPWDQLTDLLMHMEVTQAATCDLHRLLTSLRHLRVVHIAVQGPVLLLSAD